METLKKDFDQLHKEYQTLLEIQRETAEERDNFFTELQQAQRSCTPRPNWAKCSGATCIQLIFNLFAMVYFLPATSHFLLGF